MVEEVELMAEDAELDMKEHTGKMTNHAIYIVRIAGGIPADSSSVSTTFFSPLAVSIWL
jgi:hypothetical protein